MKFKGKLLIIGGAEDRGGHDTPDMETKNIKFKKYEILKELLAESKKDIEIITTGSRIQSEIRRSYERTFEKIGYARPRFIMADDRFEANSKEYLRRIKNCGSVFFTGGDQCRLVTKLRGTALIKLIKKRFIEDPHFLVAGTSAGAMALSDVMITGGHPQEALIDHDIELDKGFGLIPNCIIDTHFIKRGRFGRLAHAVLMYPNHIGIGLGEDTALIIKNAEHAECRGSGMVVIIDVKNVSNTNIKQVKQGEPVYAENLKVHLLIKGSKFLLKKRKFK